VSLLINIWFCWRNLKKGLRLKETEEGGRIILKGPLNSSGRNLKVREGQSNTTVVMLNI